MSLLIISTLPSTDKTAQGAINKLIETVTEHKAIYTEKMKISPCIGCNDCWLKTPGVCAVKDDYSDEKCV